MPERYDNDYIEKKKQLLGDTYLDAYSQKVKLKGYSDSINVFQAFTEKDAGKILSKTMPLLSPAEHELLSKTHKKQAETCMALWSETVEKAAQETYGRPYQITDYRVSGIASDDFSDEHKKLLRHYAHAETAHKHLMTAHSYAKKLCRNKGSLIR
jgi:hypothetical protein